MTEAAKGRLAYLTGVFVITCATLMLQIVETRILSVTSWYYVAFFIVGMAMFGLGAGGVWVYVRRDHFTRQHLSEDLAYYVTAFGCSSVGSLLILVSLVPNTAQLLFGNSLTAEILGFVIWAIIAGALALPFFFSGVAVSLALTRSPYRVAVVYAVDLIGAAFGCLVVLFLMSNVDAPSAMLWIGGFSLLAALAFRRAAIGSAREKKAPLQGVIGRPGALLPVLIVLAIANTAAGGYVRPVIVKNVPEIAPWTPDNIAWNSYTRITAGQVFRGPAHLWGPSPRFEPSEWEVEQRSHQMDGLAGSMAYSLPGGVEDAGFLRYDVANIAYALDGLNHSAVIGVGAGRDLLAGRYFGLESVTGVEVNPLIIDLLYSNTEFAEFAGIQDLTGVEVVVDEARSWFSRTDRQFDLIQMSLIDTWAATGAGAFTLTENGLYTVEAWETFISRLTPNGAFTVSRYFSPEFVGETGRLVSLAMAAGFRSGFADPRAHIFVASTGNVATMVLSKEPLTAANLERLERLSAELEFDVLLRPTALPEAQLLTQIVTTASMAELERTTRTFRLDLTPPTDNRPFFFNSLPFWDAARILALAATGQAHGDVVTGNLRATKTLVELLILSVGFSLICLILPLRKTLRRIPGGFIAGSTSYFFLIGFGFMIAEIAMMQRLSIFLGHPIYSLSIVLFSIILTTGVGSAISDKVPLDSRMKIVVWSAMTALYIFALSRFVPHVIDQFIDDGLLVRAMISVLMISPAGVLMGFGFPTGMGLARRASEDLTPWLWAVNGAAGVTASVIAIIISIAFGIDAAIMVAGICYALLPLCAALCESRQPGAAGDSGRSRPLQQTN